VSQNVPMNQRGPDTASSVTESVEGSAGPPVVLIVDDDTDMARMLKRVLERRCPCRATVADSGERALEELDRCRPDVVLTDIKMPGFDGLALLRRTREIDPSISVILMTGYGTVEMAVKALKEGAYDFFQKPFDNDHVVHAVQRSLERVTLLRENRRLQAQLESAGGFSGFVGRSARLREVFSLIRRIADTDVTVLIRGESGTGKELAARALHALSGRARLPLVTVNCPALPEHILESELFGYIKGAFTGALRDKKGLFLEAEGSTILLDEIGDIPVSLQTKLLRVLQEKEIRPLGQTRNIQVDVRVLASTNQDLQAKIRNGSFREDLFYRLNVVTVTMPSLADIQEDIPLLAQHFLKRSAREYGDRGLVFLPAALRCLVRRRWPGNVRELQNVVKRAVLLAEGPEITPSDLMSPAEQGPVEAGGAEYLPHLPYNAAKQMMVESFSREYLGRVLREHAGNVTAAARASGLGRQAFQRLLRRFGMEASGYRCDPDANQEGSPSSDRVDAGG